MIRIILKEAKTPTSDLYGYDAAKEKIGKKFVDSDLVSKEDKVQTIINVYNAAPEETKEFFSSWYVKAGAAVEELARKYNIKPDVAKCVTAILSPGNTFRRNLNATETLIRNYKFGENKRVDTNNISNAIKAMSVLTTGDINKVDWKRSPKTSLFFQCLLDPTKVDKGIVLDGHAISIWLGKKLKLKSPDISSMNTKTNLSLIKADYQQAAEKLGIEPHALQAVTWAVWKNTLAAEKLAAKTKV